MIICCNCRKEMRCDKNGVAADFGFGHCYAADRYKCPSCGVLVLDTVEKPHFDPNYKYHDEYLQMEHAS